jgi:AcrR family transcriptional regulator
MAAQIDPRRRGTRAAETAARRLRLLEAATTLAAEGGYDAVQMRDVASRAGVALGTLYRHYSSKDQLLLAALAAQAALLRDRLEHRPPTGTSPAARVADVLRRACRSLERQPRVTAAMVTAMSSSDEGTAPSKREVDETLKAIISSAIDDDVDDLDGVVSVLGHVWFSTLNAWVGGISEPGRMAAELEQAARLLLDGRGRTGARRT